MSSWHGESIDTSSLPRGGHDELSVQFKPTIDDHLALNRHLDRSTEEGRAEARGRIWSAVFIGGLLSVVLFVLGVSDGVRFRFLLIGQCVIVVVIFIGYLIQDADIRRRQQRRIARVINDAHKRASHGDQPDPLEPHEVRMGPLGYSVQTNRGLTSHSWNEISRVELSEGLMVLHRPGDRVERESADLMIPVRAFGDAAQARSACELIRAWRARSAQVVG